MASQILKKISKCTFSIAIMTLISSFCLGQSEKSTSGSESRSVLDFYLGINVNSVSGSEWDYVEQLNIRNGRGSLEKAGVVGAEAGVNYLRSLGRTSHMRTGLQLTLRQLSIPNTIYVDDPSFKTTYLGLPLLFGANSLPIGQTEKTSVGIEAGAVYMLALSDKSYGGVEYHNTIDAAVGLLVDVPIQSSLKLSFRYRWLRNLNAAYTVLRSAGSNDLKSEYFYSSHCLTVSLIKIL